MSRQGWFEASACLRFIERDGKRILQQAWLHKNRVLGELVHGTEFYWYDVPMADDESYMIFQDARMQYPQPDCAQPPSSAK